MSNKRKLVAWRSRPSSRLVAEMPKESQRTRQRVYRHYHRQMALAEQERRKEATHG